MFRREQNKNETRKKKVYMLNMVNAYTGSIDYISFEIISDRERPPVIELQNLRAPTYFYGHPMDEISISQ